MINTSKKSHEVSRADKADTLSRPYTACACLPISSTWLSLTNGILVGLAILAGFMAQTWSRPGINAKDLDIKVNDSNFRAKAEAKELAFEASDFGPCRHASPPTSTTNPTLDACGPFWSRSGPYHPSPLQPGMREREAKDINYWP